MLVELGKFGIQMNIYKVPLSSFSFVIATGIIGICGIYFDISDNWGHSRFAYSHIWSIQVKRGVADPINQN